MDINNVNQNVYQNVMETLLLLAENENGVTIEMILVILDDLFKYFRKLTILPNTICSEIR